MTEQAASLQKEQDTGHTKRPDQEPKTTQLTPVQDMIDYYREYAREKPEITALWCLGIGFVLGWKLKLW